MKIFLTIILFLVLYSCSDLKILEERQQKVEPSSRIKVTERRMTAYGPNLLIVEIDDHEYVYYSQGSITHLESCPCKKGD
jgi:flagellar biogenesis protein FliO